MSDRRTLFFLCAALAAGLLYPFAPSGLRWVPAVVAATYAVLMVLAALDARGRRRS